MNATKLLKQQHRAVKKLFAEADREDAPGRLQKLAFQICDQLAVHATIEEKQFYPAAMLERTEDLLREAVEEHLGVKRIIADLLADDPGDPQFKAKLTVLKEMVQHHVEEEEETLFPRIEKALGDAELKQLGARMEGMAAAILAKGSPRDAVPGDTRGPAPLPMPKAKHNGAKPTRAAEARG